MPRWTLNWKRGPVDVELPDDGTVRVIERPDLPVLGTPVDLVRDAIEHPIGTPPLREMLRPGQRVALLVTDMQDRILGHQGVGDFLLSELGRAGIQERDVTIVHAAGMHGHPGGRSAVTERLIARVGCYVEHDPFDESSHAFVGVTPLGTPVWVNRALVEADFVLGVGQCSPSLYGFQGGAGIVLPGVSAADTVRFNHNRIVTTRVSSVWGPGNPMREDVMNAGDLARLQFKIDFTGNKVFAGYFRDEWPVGVKYNEEHLMPQVEPADLYVFAPGGEAALMSTCYMHIESAARATKRDGVVIAVVSGRSHPPFPARPLEETMAEFRYATRRWCEETGDENPLHAFWHHRDGVCKEELWSLPLPEISRVIARFQGEPRSTTHVWSHRHSVESRRCILVSEGVSAEDGAAFGFLATYPSFAEAYAHALRLTGSRPATLANMPPNGAIPFVRNSEPMGSLPG